MNSLRQIESFNRLPDRRTDCRPDTYAQVMKLKHLRSICEIANKELNVTRASMALNISQPGISHHIRLLEQELGVPLFVRDKQRLVALTPAGRAVLPLARRAVAIADDISKVAQNFARGSTGSLTIATAHTYARSSLPPVIKRFLNQNPQVEVRLRQGSTTQILQWVSGGEADFAVVTAPPEEHPDLSFFACAKVHRVVLTPPKHPLLGRKTVTMEDLAAFPMIGYEHGFSVRSVIMQTFEARNLVPKVVLSVTDPDIMKTYVMAGVGIAIVANTDYDRGRDRNLRVIDAQHLFPSSLVHVGVKRDRALSRHALKFLALLAPDIAKVLERAG